MSLGVVCLPLHCPAYASSVILLPSLYSSFRSYPVVRTNNFYFEYFISSETRYLININLNAFYLFRIMVLAAQGDGN